MPPTHNIADNIEAVGGLEEALALRRTYVCVVDVGVFSEGKRQ
jgi:hypothetical protein